MEKDTEVRNVISGAVGKVVSVDTEKQTARIHWNGYITVTERVPLAELELWGFPKNPA